MDSLRGPPAATLARLLDDDAEHDHASAARLLAGLTVEEAMTRLLGAPHTIADLLAHLHANNAYNLRMLQAGEPGAVEPPDLWPEVRAESLEELREHVLAELRELARWARTGDLERVLFEATEAEPAWTAGYKLAASVAKHTSYHLGQIALLRKMLAART